MSSSTSNPSSSASKLTAAQKALIEKNKLKALQLRKSRVSKRPLENGGKGPIEAKVKHAPLEIDTGSGFFIEESFNDPGTDSKDTTSKSGQIKVVHQPGPILEADDLFCLECDKPFIDSYLYSKFDHPVCDGCKDPEKHIYITKTEGKTSFLLKDEDFDKREPALKFIVRKNPHNPRWGDMKLFLLSQVEKRAVEVWGSKEKIEEAMEDRSVNREKTKQKKFDKKLKELRNSVRSSLWRKDLSGHTHEYEDEVYDEEEDMYSKTCSTCDHVWTYEKM